MSDVTELTAAEKLISLENLARYDENIKGHIQDRLSDISGAVVDAELSETSTNAVQNKIITEELNKKINASEIADWAKAESKPKYTAEEVGADPVGSANTAKTESNAYTDEKIAALINGAPTTLDTLKEIADAMAENESIVDALETAIGTKANKTDIPTSLPANGGNADTVDGIHANAFMRWTVDTLDGDILTWASAQTVPTCISKISNIGTTPTDSPFSDGNTEAIYFVYMLAGGRKLVHCYAYHYSDNFTSSVHFTRVVTGNAWSSGWRNVADGGNADTVDGLHASNFMKCESSGRADTMGFDSENDLWISIDGTKYQIPFGHGRNTINADTVDGKHSTDFVATHPQSNYDCNTLFDAGLYLVVHGTNTPSNVDCGSLLVMPYRKPYGNETPDYVTQIFIPTGDYSSISMWYRTSISDKFNEWKSTADDGNANTANYASSIAKTASNSCLRNMSSGTAAATTANCPAGAWYGQHD